MVQLTSVGPHAEKKRSSGSMPTRILRPRLRLVRFEVLPDFGLETPFRALIGFKLHRFHFSQIMAVGVSTRGVVSQKPPPINPRDRESTRPNSSPNQNS